MVKRDEGVVVHLHALAPAIELGVDVARGTEEQKRLIDQMAPEIEEESAGFFGCAALTPVVSCDGAPAIESRLQAKRGANRILREELPKREEIAVPPTILKDAQHDVASLRFSDNGARFRDGCRKGLVDDDGLLVRDRLERERSVCAIGRGDHDDIEIPRVLPESRHAVDDARIGVRARGIRPTLGVARDDGREPEPRRRHDQRRVKRCAGETVSNETNAKHGRKCTFSDMTEHPIRFDTDSVRESWDRAAAGFDRAVASGLDYYRLEFFGPAQVALCGDVRGSRLIDVGCGSGYFAREMARRGARVTGIDISPRMIALATQHETDAPLGIAYQVGDAADIASHVAAASFDMATSCMALQDMPNAAAVLRSGHAVLRPGGRFVASITHPCSDMPFRRWERDEYGQKRWLCVDRYFERRPIEYTWERFGEPVTTVATHATLEDWFGWIHDAGFQLRAFQEPSPTPEALRRTPDLEDAARVPYYVFFDLVKPV